MSLFVLRPARLVANRVVTIEGAAPLSLTLKQMYERFASSGDRVAKQKVVELRPGCYFGLMKDEQQQPRNFTIFIPSRDNKVDWLLRQKPGFAESILELYEVETVRLDSQVLNEESHDTH